MWLECPICYAKFKKSGCKKYCDDCRKHRRDEIDAYVKEQKVLKDMRIRPVYTDIDDIVTQVEEYNREHGTHMTYGQYVAMIDGRGKLVRK